LGTSKDYTGATGGGWTAAKRLASRIASDGPTTDRVGRYVEAYVVALGGSARAVEASAAATRAAAGVGGFFESVRERGLDQTLTDFGLAEAIGKSSMELISMLADRLAGDGATLDDNAARDALVDCLELEFQDKSYDEIKAEFLTDDEVRDNLATFLARYVFRKVLPLLATRLNRATADVRRRTEQELDGYTRAKCVDAVRDLDLRGFNAMESGLALAQTIVERAYALFSA
jgi:hypothetical protein